MLHILCHQRNTNDNDTPAHLLEWPKSKTLTAPRAGENVEQDEFSQNYEENEEWYSHCGRHWEVS